MTMEADKDSTRALELANEVLEALGIKRRLIGALAIQALLGVAYRVTLDIDIAILVSSWDQYGEIRDALMSRGFRAGRQHHRLLLGSSHVDLLPYSPAMLEGTLLIWPEGQTMDMTGFEHVFDGEETIEPVHGVRWPVVSIPVFVVLKLACFRDRGLSKDLADVFCCLEHYDETPETSRRYEVHAEDPDITWDDAGAYLLGKAVREYSSAGVRVLVEDFRDSFADPDAPAIDGVLRQMGRQGSAAEQRMGLVKLVRAFLRGFGL